MTDFHGKEFPRWVYHHKHAPDGQICNSEEEAKQLGRGWVDSKLDFPKPSKVAVWLKVEFKPWIDEWKWLFKVIAAILSAIAAITFFASKFTVQGGESLHKAEQHQKDK